jgi:hypothetical protein
MNSSGATAKVEANVDVRPVRSQVFLVAVVMVSAILIICSALLIGKGQSGGWVFLLLAALLLFVGYKSWEKSQVDVDLLDAHPTLISLPDGTSVSTDSRILRSPEGLRGITQLCDEVLCRQPLPAPDGLVDSSVQIIPDSKGDAQEIVNQINAATQASTNALIDALGLGDVARSKVTQQVAIESNKGPDETHRQNLNVPIDG